MALVKNAVFVFIIFCCFSSCSNKATTFNNELVDIQESVLKEVSSFGKKMQLLSAGSPGLYQEKNESQHIDSFITEKINKAKRLPAPKNGENLKEAILKQLQFEKDIIGKIGKLSDTGISEEDKAQIETELLGSTKESKELEANVRSAQEAFAKQYHFKLKNK